MDGDRRENLQRLLDAPLATSRGGAEAENGVREERSPHERKRPPPETVEVDLNRPGKRPNGRDRGFGTRQQQQSSQGRGPPPAPRYSQRGPPQRGQPQRQSPGGHGTPRRRTDGPGGGRSYPPRRSSGDDETHFRYRWTLTADDVQILSVLAFGTELLTVSSNGNLRLDAGGSRSFRHFQALNMCLQPLQLKLAHADTNGQDETSENHQKDDQGQQQHRGYRGGDWKLKHVKHGWTQDFTDGMKLSAFPNRDWKRIMPKLKALPQSIVFSYEPENF